MNISNNSRFVELHKLNHIHIIDMFNDKEIRNTSLKLLLRDNFYNIINTNSQSQLNTFTYTCGFE